MRFVQRTYRMAVSTSQEASPETITRFVVNSYKIRNLSFPRRWIFKSRSSGLWRHIVLW